MARVARPGALSNRSTNCWRCQSRNQSPRRRRSRDPFRTLRGAVEVPDQRLDDRDEAPGGGCVMRRLIACFIVGLAAATPAAAADQIYFAAKDNITDVLVQKINAENVRIDITCWYRSEER